MSDLPPQTHPEDDDWPEPIHTRQEREKAEAAYAATMALRQRVLRYGYLALGVLVALVIVLALTH